LVAGAVALSGSGLVATVIAIVIAVKRHRSQQNRAPSRVARPVRSR
jgi:hypothetical protein